MKILVLSDSHCHFENMKKVISRSDADAVLFLGDGYREFERLSESDIGQKKRWLGVRGNCDLGCSTVPDERFFKWEGVNILMVHGHCFSVKSGTDNLIEKAAEVNADLVLYGHTHTPEDRVIETCDGKKLRIFNPGSIGKPNSGPPSFGFLLLEKGRVEYSNTVPFEDD